MRSSWRTDWKNAPGHIGGAEYGKKKKTDALPTQENKEEYGKCAAAKKA